MDRAEIQSRIVSIIHEQKTLDPAAITPESSLRDAGIDSLDALNILFALEESFSISIPDEDARGIRTLDDMTSVVVRLVEER